MSSSSSSSSLSSLPPLIALARDDSKWSSPSLIVASIEKCMLLLGEKTEDYFDAVPSAGVVFRAPNTSTSVPTTTNLSLNSNPSSTLGGLCLWMEENKVDSSLFRLEASDDPILGNELKAVGDISKHQLLMKIPKNMMLSAKFSPGRADAIADLLDKFEDNPTFQLAVCLLYHKRMLNSSTKESGYNGSKGGGSGGGGSESKNGPFSAYISALPTRFSIPLFWSREILHSTSKLPCYSKCVQTIRATLGLCFRFKDTLKRFHIPNFKDTSISWAEFRWAMAIVNTRQNSIPYNSTSSSPTLVPIWDIMNHEWGEMTSQYNSETETLDYYAMKAIKFGESVVGVSGGNNSSSSTSSLTSITMCYGTRSNEELLVYSGFAVPDNFFDSMALSIPMPQDAIAKIRELLLSNLNDPNTSSVGIGPGAAYINVNISRSGSGNNSISVKTLLKCLYSVLVGMLSKDLAVKVMRGKDAILKLIHTNTASSTCPSAGTFDDTPTEASIAAIAHFISTVEGFETGLTRKVADSLTLLLKDKAELLNAISLSSASAISSFDISVFGEIKKLIAGYVTLLEATLSCLDYVFARAKEI